ncbi:3'-5' exonuclease [Streptacidiphilus jiangxiensis]|uniref:DNA polymerase-3 subunit epsilon n=1 Tax=Streptacidiphilus jiangxiensis TaxID=235985 RepID=A0A1H8ARZ0_STRJI|nr:3'-5' exonuclease [Streptacidiphilus jiangxiensis]SEM72578.1 DNA polymerase-3 subunit epsilon [Streptacidiphilus jiangxiensis]
MPRTLTTPKLAHFAVVDVESTGTDARTDRVLSVGVVLADRTGAAIETWQTLVNPGPGVDVGARHIHGIGPEDLTDAPAFAEIAPTLLGLLDGRVAVAHNTAFDLAIIDAECARIGLARAAGRTVCTLTTARKAFDGSHRLGACCERFGITLERPHEALSDAAAATELLARFIADGHVHP